MNESFVCPACGMESFNPNDVRFGYCGACHAFTGEDPPEVYFCGSNFCDDPACSHEHAELL